MFEAENVHKYFSNVQVPNKIDFCLDELAYKFRRCNN